ncbi:MAG: bifunctional hydroxymethylpyrimidine kinase/phosphomethylpyrimidine kinase [Candidatus Dormibacteria bacterium]
MLPSRLVVAEGVPVAATIAGSDSGGGAGIQADLKTFAACGVYGCSAIVALTAQNTTGVRAVRVTDAAMVAAQVDAIAEDFRPAAWKTGMLASSEVVSTVIERLSAIAAANVVVDPVMVAKSGAQLLPGEAIDAMRQGLLPLALVVTPNLPEAESLTGIAVSDAASGRRAVLALARLGPRVVVLKGGHADGDPVVDTVFDARDDSWITIRNARVHGTSTHGTGCTLSAAIAAFLARGMDPLEAVRAARRYLQEALLRAPGLGAGHGPLGHLPFVDQSSGEQAVN